MPSEFLHRASFIKDFVVSLCQLVHKFLLRLGCPHCRVSIACSAGGAIC